MYNCKTSFFNPKMPKERAKKLVSILRLYIFIFVENWIKYDARTIFQLCWEQVLIHWILIGFEWIREKVFLVALTVNRIILVYFLYLDSMFIKKVWMHLFVSSKFFLVFTFSKKSDAFLHTQKDRYNLNKPCYNSKKIFSTFYIQFCYVLRYAFKSLFCPKNFL